jgi:hypothetical protein
MTTTSLSGTELIQVTQVLKTGGPAAVSEIVSTGSIATLATGGFLRAQTIGSILAPAPAVAFPSVYPNPPTVTGAQASTGSNTNPVQLGFNGTALGLFVKNAATAAGSNVLNFTSTTYVSIGQAVTHRIPSTLVNNIPPGTVVVSKTSTTVTISNNVIGTGVAINDNIQFGPQIVSFLGTTPTPSGFLCMVNTCNGNASPEPYAIEFDYYGVQCDAFFQQGSGTLQYWIWVDGQPCTSDMGLITGASGSSAVVYRVTLAFNNSSDNTARWRRIRIYLNNYANFAGLSIGPTDSVTPTKSFLTTMAAYGDSYVEGTVQTTASKNIYSTLSQIMGWAPPFLCGQGGTGYINNASGATGKAAYTDPVRLAALIATQADIVIVEGSLNDSTFTPAQVTTAATAALTAIVNGMPNSKIYVVGVQAITGSPSTANFANNAAVKAVALSLGLLFIDPIDEEWITGTGNTGAPTGFGNADIFVYSDAVHPANASATEYWARRIGADIQATYLN